MFYDPPLSQPKFWRVSAVVRDNLGVICLMSGSNWVLYFCGSCIGTSRSISVPSRTAWQVECWFMGACPSIPLSFCPKMGFLEATGGDVITSLPTISLIASKVSGSLQLPHEWGSGRNETCEHSKLGTTHPGASSDTYRIMLPNCHKLFWVLPCSTK